MRGFFSGAKNNLLSDIVRVLLHIDTNKFVLTEKNKVIKLQTDLLYILP